MVTEEKDETTQPAEQPAAEQPAEGENFDAYHKEMGKKALEELGQHSTAAAVLKAIKWALQGGISRGEIDAFLAGHPEIAKPAEEPAPAEEPEKAD